MAAPAAPPASPPPRRAGPAPPAGDWCVQVGAANDRAESERIAAKFERFQPADRDRRRPGEGRWHRVRVGSFETKAAAEKFLKDLTRETGAKGFVTSTH